MTFSLNEVDALAKKAARGAGYPWGLAEEAGKAVRWLCVRDQDGCGALAELLERFDGVELASTSPAMDGVWHARGGMLCPLITGAALSDHAPALLDAEIKIGAIASPSLLIPFAAYAAHSMKQVVCMEWSDGSATTDGTDLSFKGHLMATATYVTIRRDGTLGSPAPMCQRAAPSGAIWATLERFAHRTYAPATDASRRKGAGGDTTDND